MTVSPDIVLAPVVGFDEERFRLGYGGGYFDRTLASLLAKPYVVGVGYAEAGIRTIYPLDHDIPMDVIVT
jgi:5-formyltetrahydrofolate cyclo-ligase